MPAGKIVSLMERTNEPPNQVQRGWIEAKISELEEESALIDQKVADFMDVTQTQRDANRANHRRLTGLLTLLRKFPNEVLLEIFGHFLPSDRASILCVSQVSRLWRKLVVKTPSFWTDVYLPCPSRSSLENPSFKNIWDSFCFQFDRSQGQPMSLTIKITRLGLVTLFIDQLFAKSTSNRYRFRAISFHNFETGHIRKMLNYYEAYSEKASSLHSLNLFSPPGFRDASSVKVTLRDFMKLPSLSTVNLSWPYFDFGLSKDWTLLTSISLRVLDQSEPTRCLNHCPNLLFLDIDHSQGYGAEYTSETALVLQHLRSFSFKSRRQPSNLLNSLIAPKLEELVFVFPRREDDDPSLAKFLQRLDGRLLEFHCSGEVATRLFADSPHGGKDLNSLRNLKNLRIMAPFDESSSDELQDEPSIFRDLLHRDKSKSKFDKLETLEILDHPQLDYITAPHLADLLRSRCVSRFNASMVSLSNTGTLRRVVLTYHEERLDMDDLQHFTDNGLLKYYCDVRT
ncbi:hypothetical protein CPB83DRAFT_893923 [Crepidotus variabilis]|uniref:F-box domain-containing protein n=1 Tax=Crepidotus variabilis TaxID=179855 RepID=A0A9P6JQ93_9AGAR|nr:hypothetical protein CPB83DRAFT_893923 [Crepidotus variabilis]